MAYLGIDTSNYTTSASLFFPETNLIVQKKKLLPVKKGEKGLRQSDAVFHHTQQFPEIFAELMSQSDEKITAIGVSTKPRNIDGSYMPCFTVGKGIAECIGAAEKIKVFPFSHQHGHIVSALYSADKLELINEPFIAFHVSGGTTETLLVRPDSENIISCEIIASSSDLKAGQAVDRVGLMMNLNFPCGAELDLLSQKSDKEYRIKAPIKDGNCSLSGVENKCSKMLENGETYEDTAKFCIDYISTALEKTTEYVLEKYGDMPLLFSGGVMSNSTIKKRFTKKFGAYFAESQFSSDNAAGIAILAYLKEKK